MKNGNDGLILSIWCMVFALLISSIIQMNILRDLEKEINTTKEKIQINIGDKEDVKKY